LRHICGSDRWEDIHCEVNAVLVPEPTNRYDANAVMVQVDEQMVGYLSGDPPATVVVAARPAAESGERPAHSGGLS